jgi:predicted dehydrogenase
MIALIVGYGSIGQKHYKILKRIKRIKKIYVYSSQKRNIKNLIKNFDKIKSLEPDYIVIASTTDNHISHLEYFNNNFCNKKILVEKPIYIKSNFTIREKNKNKIRVGYQFRVNEIINYLKKFCNNNKIYKIQVYCQSYLPNWRKRKYQITSSAKKKTGGGVMLDVSHEIDYLQYIFPQIRLSNIHKGKISDLKINTEDYASINYKSKKIIIQADIDYLSLIPKREINVIGKDITLNINLLKNSIKGICRSKKIDIEFLKNSRDDNFYKMHNDFLTGGYQTLCTIKQAKRVLKLLNL